VAERRRSWVSDGVLASMQMDGCRIIGWESVFRLRFAASGVLNVDGCQAKQLGAHFLNLPLVAVALF